jgi:hypothetical protein
MYYIVPIYRWYDREAVIGSQGIGHDEDGGRSI